MECAGGGGRRWTAVRGERRGECDEDLHLETTVACIHRVQRVRLWHACDVCVTAHAQSSQTRLRPLARGGAEGPKVVVAAELHERRAPSRACSAVRAPAWGSALQGGAVCLRSQCRTRRPRICLAPSSPCPLRPCSLRPCSIRPSSLRPCSLRPSSLRPSSPHRRPTSRCCRPTRRGSHSRRRTKRCGTPVPWARPRLRPRRPGSTPSSLRGAGEPADARAEQGERQRARVLISAPCGRTVPRAAPPLRLVYPPLSPNPLEPLPKLGVSLSVPARPAAPPRPHSPAENSQSSSLSPAL